MRRRAGAFLLGVLLGSCAALAGDGRIEISQESMPLTIRKPGSYVVTEPLSVSSTTTNGITVAASDVTIDLNGFSLSGPGLLSGLDGIHQSTQFVHLAVFNGHVDNWGEHGIYAAGANAVIGNVRVRTSLRGMSTGIGSLVFDCGVDNVVWNGIVTDLGSVLADCVVCEAGQTGLSGDGAVFSGCAVFDAGEDGLNAGAGSVVRRCSVSSSSDDGMVANRSVVAESASALNGGYGIALAGASAILDSVLRQNTQSGVAMQDMLIGDEVVEGTLVKGCLAAMNSAHGIDLLARSAVFACVASGNDLAGIALDDYGMAVGNICDNNRYGICLGEPGFVQGCRIEDNTLVYDTTGLLVRGATNVIMQNVASGCATNWDVTYPTNLFHALSVPTNGWPWANLDY